MRVLFCGVGALGSQAAVACRNLDAQLVVIDGDRVESKNLLSQAYVKQSVGKNKADALRLQLANFFGVKVESFPVWIEATNIATIADGADVLIDCFDNAASRRLLSEHARATATPLVHAAISAAGDFGLVRWDDRFVADEEDEPGQATCENGDHLPMIAAVSAALGRVIQDFVAKGIVRDVIVTPEATTTTWKA